MHPQINAAVFNRINTVCVTNMLLAIKYNITKLYIISKYESKQDGIPHFPLYNSSINDPSMT